MSVVHTSLLIPVLISAATVVVKPDYHWKGIPKYSLWGMLAAVMDPESNRPYPTTSQIALAAGEQAAKNIGALRHNQANGDLPLWI